MLCVTVIDMICMGPAQWGVGGGSLRHLAVIEKVSAGDQTGVRWKSGRGGRL